MPQASRLIAGAMSGTSADGVDAAIVRIDGRGLEMSAALILHRHRPYDPALKQAIFALRAEGKVSLAELARIGREISLAYADCINDAIEAANLKPENIAAIAAHGQTLYHAPPETIQWLDPALIAARTHCAVVSDFRRADCAAGGQGAPLVPFADYILFRHPTKNRALVNIGGIANITCLFAGASIDQIWAFDTGPGNCISDFLMREHQPLGPGYDADGELAATGKVHRKLFNAFCSNQYFGKLGPKSTDAPAMIEIFRVALRATGEVSIEDQLATACAVAADQICRALSVFGGQFIGEMILSGGGVLNQTLLRMLRELGSGPMRVIEELGYSSQAKEAIAFALLGAATLDNFPSNVPSCTGASRAVVLGSITPRPYNSNQ